MDSFVRILEGIYTNLFMVAHKMEEADKALTAQSTNPLGMGDLKLAEAMILAKTNENGKYIDTAFYDNKGSSATTDDYIESKYGVHKNNEVVYAPYNLYGDLKSSDYTNMAILNLWNNATYYNIETIKVDGGEVTNYYLHTNEKLRMEIEDQYAKDGNFFSYLIHSGIFNTSIYINSVIGVGMKQMPPEMSFEDRKLVASLMGGEIVGEFFAITINGVRAYKSLKTGEVVSEDVVFGSGAGGGAKKGAAEAANKTNKNFWKSYDKLPKEIQKQADEAFKLFKENPNHPGLNFEQLSGGKYYSVRINGKYRGYGRKLADGGIEWVEINGHDYDKAIRMLENMK